LNDPELDAVQEEMFGARKDGLAQYPGRSALAMAALSPAFAAGWLGLLLGAGRHLLRREAR